MSKAKQHPRKEERRPPDGRAYEFLHPEKAKRAYEAAREIVERKFHMDPDRLVVLAGTTVTVPEWFPYEPLPLDYHVALHR